MATTFVTYESYMNSTDSPAQASLVAQQLDVSPFIGMLKWARLNDIEYKFSIESDLNAAAFRFYNANYADSTIRAKDVTIDLKPTGGSFANDRAFKNRNTLGAKKDWVQSQIEAKARANSYHLKDIFINGDDVASPANIKGAKQWIDAMDSSTNDIKLQFAGTTNGIKLSAATVLEIKSSLDALVNATLGKPDLILSNRTNMDNIYNKTLTSAVNNVLAQVFVPAEVTVNGLTTLAYKYRGIPIIDMGQNVAGTEILPFTETIGSGSTGSSLYAVKFGENWTLPLMDQPIQVYSETERPGVHYDVEQIVAYAFKHRRCAARSEGILSE